MQPARPGLTPSKYMITSHQAPGLRPALCHLLSRAASQPLHPRGLAGVPSPRTLCPGVQMVTACWPPFGWNAPAQASGCGADGGSLPPCLAGQLACSVVPLSKPGLPSRVWTPSHSQGLLLTLSCPRECQLTSILVLPQFKA